MAASRSPQSGVFALGTASHAYLEFDAAGGRSASEVVRRVASLREPRTTMGGVNLVAGCRPETWRKVFPDDAPAELAGFDAEIAGVDGFVMTATQHDAVLRLSGSAYDVIFDVARAAMAKPADSHVASTDQDRFGKIFRRNTPYGTVSDRGTMFVGFSATQEPLAAMLESMAGLADGHREPLTRYTQPRSGAYYFVPSIESLHAVSGGPASA